MVADLHKRPSEMRAAIEFTAAETGFALHLIEKDYWCSILLKELNEMSDMPLVFKGGTLLSKAFAVFERLSEDLDFTIPTPSDFTKGRRRTRAAKVRERLENLVDRYDLQWEEDWRGHNQSRQYTARLQYPSIYRGTHTILIEVSQREEPLLELGSAKLETLLLDPMHRDTVLEPFESIALNLNEAYAEKARAALTRLDPAIRDAYDLWQGYSAGLFDPSHADWIDLVRQKCVDFDIRSACSEARMEAFRRRVRTDLEPVLRVGRLDEFPLSDALELIETVHSKVARS